MSRYSLDPQVIVDFWRELGADRWFVKDPELDETIRQRFGDVYEQAAQGLLDHWQETPTGALALVILLDQFPRNMFRGTPQAFATDAKALAIAHMALERGDQHAVGEDVNQFLALPLMHSEQLSDQEACVEWMGQIGEANLPFAEEHRDIIRRFGRFPHRNVILGRPSSETELTFLAEGGFGG
ncbi:DUF924 family protein [Mangrovicella endophytica]|uniref:DUF924 family protein n=1 Tax=Mangrovicella endophytica TaxID=2066697 RepID=UPI000C9E43CA|nr:DUF924 family protein [Mangrovicella endophytica]